MQQKKKIREKTRKEKIFDNLFNMAYEPVIVDKKATTSGEGTGKKSFTTIFNALNNADEHIMIKINPGIYNQRIEIKKRDMKIQASEISQNTILISQQHPNIIVDLPEECDKVYFESLKLVHTCQNNTRHELVNPSYQSLKNQDYMNFKVNSSINTCLYVKRGIVQLDQCKISQAVYHSHTSTLPCIIVQKQGCLILNRSQVRGGGGTIGIYSNGGKIVIKQSTIRDHGVTGLLYSSINLQYPILTIKNCTFTKCNQSITLNGPFQAIIQSNSIRESQQSGIKILNGNRSKVTNNEIRYCKVGIEIKNSYPSILKNTISNNETWGCITKSCSGILCKPTLKFNSISQNTSGGMLIQGPLNSTNIFNNQLKYNNEYGIKICNRSNPHIFMNKIIKTLGNGIHANKGCSIFLQKNQIQASLKCNVLLEGPDNINSFIFRNTIIKGRGQGILAIFGEKFVIKDNQIRENYNGVVSLTGVQNIEDNLIVENQRNGILLVRDNNVTISGNQLENNKKSGIFIRDSSIGRIEDNIFRHNKSQIIIENDDNIFQNIENNNVFHGDYDIRVPNNYRCQLI